MSDRPTCHEGESHKLPIIGREWAMIAGLANALHRQARSIGDYTALREMPRGQWFEVRLADGRIARVTVELDRVEEGS
jgi:hypothetical protein